MMLKNIEFFALRLEELGLIVPDLRLNLRDRLRAYYKKHPKAMEPHPKDRLTPVLFSTNMWLQGPPRSRFCSQ